MTFREWNGKQKEMPGCAGGPMYRYAHAAFEAGRKAGLEEAAQILVDEDWDNAEAYAEGIRKHIPKEREP